MARRDTRPDPKEAALAGARCLNPHPEQVTDPEFLASDFFDARDAVQVKYEMVRKARAEEQLAAGPALRPAQLPDPIEEAFGVRVHPRSVERALARRRERHSKSRGTARLQDAEG